MRLRLLAPRYWLTWVGLGVLRLVAFLPFPILLALGRLLGLGLRHLPTSFTRIARRNLELCLPELSSEQRAALLREHFASLGVGLLEIPLAWWSSPARLARLVRVEGVEHLQAAVARGRKRFPHAGTSETVPGEAFPHHRHGAFVAVLGGKIFNPVAAHPDCAALAVGMAQHRFGGDHTFQPVDHD